MSAAPPVVELADVVVRYPGQLALDGAGLRLLAGEVHSLIGENGAGKSTLLKVLTGAVQPDAGTVRIDGSPARFSAPSEAQAVGIRMVHQELNLLPNLTVAENVLLGREVRRRFGIDWRRTDRAAALALARLGVELDPRAVVGDLPPALRQLVAIARAVDADPRVLVLDEPTSSLDADEVEELFRIIRSLRDDGVAIVFVSHFLEQVYEIADRLTVLRNGLPMGEYPTSQILRRDLVRKMLGRDLGGLDAVAERRTQDEAGEAVVLAARGIGRSGALEPTDLDVHAGEVLGVAGLLGSGRSELVRAVSGIDRVDRGALEVDGRSAHLPSPRAAMARRIVYSSEDRREEGIIAGLSVRENIVLALQAQRGWYRRMSRARQNELASSYIDALHIRPVDPDTAAGTLSGGNQQKVLLARWLALAPRIMILDEPTRGIDVGAKLEIQRLVDSLVENGLSVLYVSAEIDELLRLSDRIVVMREHRLVTVLQAEGLTREGLLTVIAEGESDGTR